MVIFIPVILVQYTQMREVPVLCVLVSILVRRYVLRTNGVACRSISLKWLISCARYVQVGNIYFYSIQSYNIHKGYLRYEYEVYFTQFFPGQRFNVATRILVSWNGFFLIDK